MDDVARAQESTREDDGSQDGLTRIVHENLRTLLEHRARLDDQKSIHERIADRLSGWAGSMYFAYAHAAIFGVWLVWNGIPGVPKWDPYPFVMLAMVASVEAIFLSTFVLVSQNRMQRAADRRADLDVQVNLLSEREITHVLRVVGAIARRMEVTDPPPDRIAADRDVPGEILEKIAQAEQSDSRPPNGHARPRRGARR